MGFDRNILYSAADALNRTAAAIGSFLDSEAAVSGLEYLEELRQDTEDKLQKVSLFLNDEWERIEGNKARLHEIYLFMDYYEKFKESVARLDNWRIDHIGADISDFDCADVGMDYIMLIGDFDKRFSFVFNYISNTIGSSAEIKRRNLIGLASRLSRYIFGIDDVVLTKAILQKEFPALKGTWTGRKNEATYFGKHFRLTCEDMNNLFFFRDKVNKLIKLHYSRNDDDKIMVSDEIAVILSEFRI